MGAKEPTYYSYLKQSGCYTAANINDGEYFKEINKSMTEIGFSIDEQNKIWALVLAILEMGNLEFDDKKHHINESSPCEIMNDLPKIAKVLGITS
jgi:myosin heavy subunit